jgi:peptide/nickel transport system substrate-binding protein
MHEIDRRSLIAKAGMVGAGLALGHRPALAQDPQRGGTLNMILQPEPATLNLAMNQQVPIQVVAGHIFQGLLTYDFDLKPRPGLARSWTISPDGMTYTFHLNENVTWHDGVPFSAEDVLFNVTEFLPKVHPRARLVFAHVSSVEALDRNTVVFKMKEAFPPFIRAFEVAGAPMLPKHLYSDPDYQNNPANLKPIGTGPFKFVEWQRGNFLKLARYDAYYVPERPYLDQIIFKVLPDAQSRLIALQSGQVDLAAWVDIDYILVSRLRSDPNLTITSKGYEYASPVAWLEINNRNKPLDNPKVRRAIWQALDRDFIVRTIFAGLCKISYGPIATTTPYHDPTVPKVGFDPKQSEALLDEVGLRRGADGKRFKLRLLPLPYGETWNLLAAYCRQALEKVGIGIDMENSDAGAYAQHVGNWDYDLALNFVSQFADPALGIARTYVSSNIRKGVYATNTEGYSNTRVDELFAKASVEQDETLRAQMYSEIQHILVDEVPVAWIAELGFPTIFNKRVHDAITTSSGVVDGFQDTWVSA